MRRLADELKDKAFRHAYAAGRVCQRIARRIKAIREDRDWSQADLGKKMGKPQATVSRLENPNYGRYTLQSLQETAAAFDVVLWVDFISFAEFQRRLRVDQSWSAVPAFDEQPTPISQGEAGAFFGKNWGFISGNTAPPIIEVGAGATNAQVAADWKFVGLALPYHQMQSST